MCKEYFCRWVVVSLTYTSHFCLVIASVPFQFIAENICINIFQNRRGEIVITEWGHVKLKQHNTTDKYKQAPLLNNWNKHRWWPIWATSVQVEWTFLASYSTHFVISCKQLNMLLSEERKEFVKRNILPLVLSSYIFTGVLLNKWTFSLFFTLCYLYGTKEAFPFLWCTKIL